MWPNGAGGGTPYKCACLDPGAGIDIPLCHTAAAAGPFPETKFSARRPRAFPKISTSAGRFHYSRPGRARTTWSRSTLGASPSPSAHSPSWLVLHTLNCNAWFPRLGFWDATIENKTLITLHILFSPLAKSHSVRLSRTGAGASDFPGRCTNLTCQRVPFPRLLRTSRHDQCEKYPVTGPHPQRNLLGVSANYRLIVTSMEFP